ncbi:MAG: hypothetical protein K2K81_01505 [Muribaculaceae bacterium]|nr:hypothetical protein [Muribaculaceae bacterium]
MKLSLLNLLALATAVYANPLWAVAADYTLPFEFSASQSTFEECKVIDDNNDGNGDGNTWKFYSSTGSPSSFRYSYHSSNQGNDWLMLPIVNFESTTTVTISFDVKSGAGDEAFDVFLGHGQTISDMTVPVVSKTKYSHDSTFETIETTVNVPGDSDNSWCLGFHAISDADQYWLDITNIRIEKATGEVTVIPGLPVIKNSSMNYLAYTATVEMPSQSITGEPLTGNMTLNVFIDDNITETFSDLSPGATKEISLTLEEGSHSIGYQAVLNEGVGSLATESVVAEKKIIIPSKPIVSNGIVTGLVYTASVIMPSIDTENNPIEGTMSLKISENGTVIHTTTNLDAGETTQVEIPLSIGTHILSFTAVLDNMSSESVEENVTVEEPVYDLPFTFNTTSDSFKECVVIDANGDGATFGEEGKWTFSDNAFCYTYNSSNVADDWIILPLVNFAENKKVKVSMNVKTGKFPEGFELWLGSARTANGMTDLITSYKPYQTDGEYRLVEISFDVPETGNKKWALGIHAISEPDQFKLYIKDISISAVGEDSAIPQPPVITNENLENGEYTATVKMPTLSVTGEDLGSEMTLKVLVDEELVLTKENLSPGDEADINLTITEGTHSISFIAVIDNNESETVTVTVTVKGEEITTGNLPYIFNITQDSFDSCIVIDVDNDGETRNDQTFGMWSYAYLGQENGGALKYTYSSTGNPADDWIILPMVDFGESKGVTVSFDVMTEYDEENFEVFLGRERSAEAMTLPVIECKNYSHKGSFESMSKLVVLPEEATSGVNEWCIGIHASSPADKFLFYIANIEIKSSVTTGINEFNENDDRDCEYYNLQGHRINSPSQGEIVIVRKGNKSYKKIVR